MSVPVSWRILFEEPYKFLHFLFLLLGKVAVYKNNTPIGETTYAITVLPKTNVEFYRLDSHTYAKAVHCRCHVQGVSVTEPLAQVEVEIQ